MFTARYVLQSTFCPHSVFMCFVWISKQTAIISLYSIDWLVFIAETECVYCAVRSTFYVLPTQCIYVFCVDLRTNSDYWLVFITETECVYCAVCTGSSYVIQVNFPTQKNCAMAQAVNRRPLIADVRVRSQASLCEICGRQSGTVAGFSPSTSAFLSQYHSTHAP